MKTTIKITDKKNVECLYSEKDIKITYCKEYDPYCDNTTDKWGRKLSSYFQDELQSEILYDTFDLDVSSLS